ncbi:hypothetical protein OG604_01130 [Streptomyces sp. NBC_01231]|nr:hypothetical protein OG604_01130 [Streptomyces sp. NBC_01231]
MSRIGDDVVVRAGFELSDDPGRGRGPAIRREWQRWVEEVLLQADEGGWLAEGVSVDDAAAAVVAATVEFEVLSGEDEAWLSEERVTGFWDLLLPRPTERNALVCASGRDPQTRTTDGAVFRCPPSVQGRSPLCRLSKGAKILPKRISSHARASRE